MYRKLLASIMSGSYKFPTGGADPQRMKLCYDASVVGTEVVVRLV